MLAPGDWFCHISLGHAMNLSAAASVLIGLGMALPAAVLAANGRRLTAFLPLFLAARASDMIDAGRLWLGRGFLVTAADLLLLCIPVAVIILLGRKPRPDRISTGLIARLVSTIACALGTWAAISLAERAEGLSSFGLSGGSWTSALLPMGVFGALLGWDRRWWPWVLAPVALLLSTGPATAVALSIIPAGAIRWGAFGFALPLFVTGLVWSAWTPLASLAARIMERARGGRARPWRIQRAEGRGWPATALLDLAAGALIASSVAMFHSWGALITQPLPTYLSQRNAAQDLRAKLDLQEAMATADTYRAKHHGLTGFDARLASTLHPSLAWQDGAAAGASASQESPSWLVMSLFPSGRGGLRIATSSASGNAFCITDSGSGPLYGEGGSIGSALSRCSSRPWIRVSASDQATFSCGNPETLICRMVQVLVHNVMAEKKPSPPSPWTVYTPPGSGQAEPVLLSNGLPGFIVEHRDGSLTLVDAVSPHRPWGIGQVVSWCFASKTFGDTDGSTFNEYGHYLSGPAPTGLITYRLGPVSSGQVPILGTVPALPRSATRTPGVQGSLCTGGEGETPARSALIGISATPAAASTSSEPPGDWTAFWGTLLVEKNKQPELCSSVAGDGSCQGPVAVAGVDPRILAFDHKHRITLSGTWLALVTDKGLANPVYVGPAPSS